MDESKEVEEGRARAIWRAHAPDSEAYLLLWILPSGRQHDRDRQLFVFHFFTSLPLWKVKARVARLGCRGRIFLFAAMSLPSSLSAVEEDALKGLFRQVYGRHSVRKQCQPLLVAYFAGRGEALGVLPLTPDASDVAAWEAEWTRPINCGS